MNTDNLSLYLSLVASTLAVMSFLGTSWRIWRDRPRLSFYVCKTVIYNKPDNKKFNMIQVMVCNIGFRPIILTGFKAIGRKSSFCMGINDEPAAYYGVMKQIFPSILDPGKTVTFHPLTFEIFENNALDPNDPKVFYDPWLYFVLVDSFGRFYHLDVKEVRWCLHMDKTWKPDNRLEKTKGYIRRKSILYKYKNSVTKHT